PRRSRVPTEVHCEAPASPATPTLSLHDALPISGPSRDDPEDSTVDILPPPPHGDGTLDEVSNPRFGNNLRLRKPDAPLAHTEALQQAPVGIYFPGVPDIEAHIVLLGVQAENEASFIPIAEHPIADTLGQVGSAGHDDGPKLFKRSAPPVKVQGLQVLLRC